MRTRAAAVVVLACLVGLASAGLWMMDVKRAEAHCQVPCGIYDDPARIAQMREDATTIAKAITSINELAGKNDGESFNQATRWVVTKEEHASHIMELASTYFLAQRVKPVAAGADGYQDYLTKLADHHAVIVAAMKTKQNTTEASVHDLEHAIDAIAKYYPKG